MQAITTIATLHYKCRDSYGRAPGFPSYKRLPGKGYSPYGGKMGQIGCKAWYKVFGGGRDFWGSAPGSHGFSSDLGFCDDKVKGTVADCFFDEKYQGLPLACPR